MAERAKPGPKPKATSKRNDPAWVAATVFFKEDTRERLQKLIAMASALDVADPGTPADQSEAIEAALQPYLELMELRVKEAMRKALG